MGFCDAGFSAHFRKSTAVLCAAKELSTSVFHPDIALWSRGITKCIMRFCLRRRGNGTATPWYKVPHVRCTLLPPGHVIPASHGNRIVVSRRTRMIGPSNTAAPRRSNGTTDTIRAGDTRVRFSPNDSSLAPSSKVSGCLR